MSILIPKYRRLMDALEMQYQHYPNWKHGVKGIWNGECNNPECTVELGYNAGGNYWHNVEKRYYCKFCAAKLNIKFNATERTSQQIWDNYSLLEDIDREGKRPDID
jgi:hypothetical protein